MKVKLYAVRDVKVSEFEMPVRFPSDAAAVRAFGDLVNDKSGKHLIGIHPDDFQILALGVFDTETGLFEQSVENVKVLASGSDFVKDN